MSRKDLQTGRALFVKKWSENLFLWALGGSLYYGFEVFFRGCSHWSMFVLGGICLLFCAKQGLWTGWREPLWKQVLWCTIFVTAAEFITGMIVNQWLGWNVWDYTGRKWQLFGQICLPFTIIFSALCVIGILLSGYLLYWLYGEEKPHFHVL